MIEIWRKVTIPILKGYEVSNRGNVCKNKKSVNFELDESGYYRVTKYNKNVKVFSIAVHRLVAMTFPEICGEWFEGCEVDHKDTNKLNNNAFNLRVCTHKENMNNLLTRAKQNAVRRKEDTDDHLITACSVNDAEALKLYINGIMKNKQRIIVQIDDEDILRFFNWDMYRLEKAKLVAFINGLINYKDGYYRNIEGKNHIFVYADTMSNVKELLDKHMNGLYQTSLYLNNIFDGLNEDEILNKVKENCVDYGYI